MSYVFIQSEPTLWTVGHYDPSGRWHAVSDHDSPGEAGERVRVLNGGNPVASAADLSDAQSWRRLCEVAGFLFSASPEEVIQGLTQRAVTPSQTPIERESWYRAGALAAQATDCVNRADGCREMDNAVNYLIDGLRLAVLAIEELAGTANPDEAA